MQTLIRKWGNSSGVIIPAAALAKAGIGLGDTIEVEASEGKITLKQASPKFTLEELLQASLDGAFDVSEEDRKWLQDKPVGKELD